MGLAFGMSARLYCVTTRRAALCSSTVTLTGVKGGRRKDSHCSARPISTERVGSGELIGIEANAGNTDINEASVIYDGTR